MDAAYRFRTRFAVDAEPTAAHATALRVDDWVARWPEAVRARLLAPGAPDGTGRRGRAVFRAPLGLYRLTITVEITDSDPPRSFAVRTRGDLDGRGTWTFTPTDGTAGSTAVRFDWHTVLRRPRLRPLEPLVRPLLVAAHHRAVRHGVAAYAEALRSPVRDLTSELVDPGIRPG